MSNSPVAPVPPAGALGDTQSVIAIYGMTIVAACVAGVFLWGTPETRSQTIGGVLGFGGAIIGFYFGASRGSQKKDEVIAAQASGEVRR